VKYLKELIIEIYQLPLVSNQNIEIKMVSIYYESDQKKIIENKRLIDEALRNTPNWKKYYNKIFEPLKYIGNHILISNNNDLDKLSTFDLDHYVFSSVEIILQLLYAQKNLLDNTKYIDKIENTISEYPFESYKYSKIIGKRFLKGEPALIDDATSSYNDRHVEDSFGSSILTNYYRQHMKGRWIEFEKILVEKKRYNILLEYLMEIEVEDPYFEKIFLENGNQIQVYKYYKKVLKKNEDFFLKNPKLLYYYFIDISEDNIPSDFSDEDQIKDFIEKFNSPIKEMLNYPELMCKYCIVNDFPIRFFEDHISISTYWSYIYATYFIYHFGLEKKNFSPKIIPSIKRDPKLYKNIKITMFLRSDGGYEPPLDPDPSLHGEKEIIKK
jgi:hypothetical protein